MAIDWRENGTLLAVRRHGENAAIVEVFTRDQGRHAGIVRGGTSRRLAPHLQPGAVLDLHWLSNFILFRAMETITNRSKCIQHTAFVSIQMPMLRLEP